VGGMGAWEDCGVAAGESRVYGDRRTTKMILFSNAGLATIPPLKGRCSHR